VGKAAAVIPLWKCLKRSGARVEAVAINMGSAYIVAVQRNIPEVMLVFDHFHIIKLFNEKLVKRRCDLQRETEWVG
jgi:transposase